MYYSVGSFDLVLGAAQYPAALQSLAGDAEQGALLLALKLAVDVLVVTATSVGLARANIRQDPLSKHGSGGYKWWG